MQPKPHDTKDAGKVPAPAPAPARPSPQTPTAAQRGLVGRYMQRDAGGVLPSAGRRTADQVATRLSEMRAATEKDLRRSVAERSNVDAEARTIDLSFSSETPVRRWFGEEILSHAPGAMVTDRLEARAPLLWMHNWDDQRGVVIPGSVRVDGGKGRAKVKYSRSAAGEQLFMDTQDEITVNVSVGYRILDAVLQEVRDVDGTEVEVWLITRWQPYEISAVSVPADIEVGHGRSLEIPQEDSQPKPPETSTVRNDIQPTGTVNPMKIVSKRDAQGNLVRAEVDDQGNIVKVLEILEEAGEGARSHEQRGERAAQQRINTILEMGERFAKAVPNAPELARKAIADGKSVEQFNSDLMTAFGERAAKPLGEQSAGGDIGLTDKEVRQFSFLRAARALAPNATASDKKAAAFEFECSETAQRQYGKEAKGILIPTDVLSRSIGPMADAQRSALNAGGVAGTGQTGAMLVQTQMLYGSFIDMLRNRATIMRLSTILGGLVGNIDIPKQTGGAQGYWLGEGEDATETNIALGQIGFSPKTVAAFTDITRRLLQQSSMDAEGMVRRDLNIALAQAIDVAGYYGSGSDKQPRGIKNYTGINGVDFASAQAPTFAELVKMETEVAADNADAGQMGYVGHTRFRGHCKTTPKFGSGTESTIWEPGGTVNGYRTEITNQVSADDTFFGNFADFIIAMWGGLDLTVDPYTLSKSGGLRLVVFQDCDMNLRRVESICWGSHNVA